MRWWRDYKQECAAWPLPCPRDFQQTLDTVTTGIVWPEPSMYLAQRHPSALPVKLW